MAATSFRTEARSIQAVNAASNSALALYFFQTGLVASAGARPEATLIAEPTAPGPTARTRYCPDANQPRSIPGRAGVVTRDTVNAPSSAVSTCALPICATRSFSCEIADAAPGTTTVNCG